MITSSAGLVAQNKQKLSMSQELLTSLQSKLRVCQEDAHKYIKEKDMITSKIQKYEESLHGLQFDNQRYEEVQRLMTVFILFSLDVDRRKRMSYNRFRMKLILWMLLFLLI